MLSAHFRNPPVKYLLASFLGALLTVLAAQSIANELSVTEHHGSHGMLIFGDADGLFASHLPMYHRPHNVQVVFRFHFSDTVVDNAVKSEVTDTGKKAGAIWTILPEPFDLMRLNPRHESTLRRLSVAVTDGHFERGGTLRFANADLVVEEVLTFRPLETQTYALVARPTLRYCVVASNPSSVNSLATVAFLVKQLGRRPEADHVVQVMGGKRLSSGCIDLHNPASTLFASETQLLDALSGSDLLTTSSALDLSTMRIRTLYLELEELE